MKILMTLMGLDIGGAETHVVELSKELNRQGHTVVVASNGGVYEASLEELGIRHVQIPMHMRSASAMSKSLKLLKELIQEEKPDLVHAHARIPAFLCGILHKQMGFPFITSAHGVFEVTPLLRLITDWGQRTVSVSEDIKTYLMENYQIPADRIHMTINGIDTQRFAPLEPDQELAKTLGIHGDPVISTVSRLDSPQELVARELIGMMPEIRKEYPNAQLLVVGGGNQEEQLRQMAQEVNLQTGADTVVMTGPRTDVAEVIQLSQIFVGVSRAALEAMAEERPTIIAGGQGYIGLLTPQVLEKAQQSNLCGRGCGSVQREKLLADVLAVLGMDKSQKEELGRFGRQVVLEQYSVSKMTRDYLDAYERLLSPVKPIRAVVSGYYGYGNLGDDAIAMAISRQMEEMERPVELTVLSRHPKQTASQYGLRAVGRFRPLKVRKTLKNSDVLISGGGSLLQDKTSTRSLMYYLFVIRQAKRLDKPVFLYANGIGPLNKEGNRRKVKKWAQQCDVITLRDADSLQELRKLGITRQDIVITGDPAFILKPGSGSLSDFGVPEGSHVIGVSLRNVPQAEHCVREFAALCDRLVREQGKTIVLLVMQEAEDEAISRQVQEQMKEKSYLVKTPGKPETMLALIGQMEAVAAMRLHTIIFAAGANVPVVGCVYDPKVQSFLNMLGMPSCGTPDTVKADAAYQTVVELLENAPENREILQEKVSYLTTQAQQTARLFRDLMEKD